ncbi:STAS domain-containing protein [Streptomyces sp. NPDC057287]|uniref:STAS domain-containing protein n=1 Tax=Streptomyces sp. NPDC057287 TaxID=3346086 RepID=UPI00363E9FAB
MTDHLCPPLTLTAESAPGAVRLRLVGDLDFDTGEQLVERARECLADDPDLRDLFMDCERLRLCDSTGLSSLLLIHRGTASRGVVLHLENPPAFLLRLLDVTGTGRLFALDGAGARAEGAEDGQPSGGTPYGAVQPPAPYG